VLTYCSERWFSTHKILLKPTEINSKVFGPNCQAGRIDDEEHWAKQAFNRTKMTSKRKSKTYFFSEVEEETATHLFPGTEKNYLKQEKPISKPSRA